VNNEHGRGADRGSTRRFVCELLMIITAMCALESFPVVVFMVSSSHLIDSRGTEFDLCADYSESKS